MSYFRCHLFICCNQRPANEQCCENYAASDMQQYLKQRVKDLGLNGKGKVRVNKAGCLDRCSEGPVIVVYPDNVWYTYVDKNDIDEIVQEHIQQGRVVERLRLSDQP